MRPSRPTSDALLIGLLAVGLVATLIVVMGVLVLLIPRVRRWLYILI